MAGFRIPEGGAIVSTPAKIVRSRELLKIRRAHAKAAPAPTYRVDGIWIYEDFRGVSKIVGLGVCDSASLIVNALNAYVGHNPK